MDEHLLAAGHHCRDESTLQIQRCAHPDLLHLVHRLDLIADSYSEWKHEKMALGLVPQQDILDSCHLLCDCGQLREAQQTGHQPRNSQPFSQALRLLCTCLPCDQRLRILLNH